MLSVHVWTHLFFVVTQICGACGGLTPTSLRRERTVGDFRCHVICTINSRPLSVFFDSLKLVPIEVEFFQWFI